MKDLKDLKVVYMGTPEFSIAPLLFLIDTCNVVCVVTKEDAYVGRKKVLTPSNVSVCATNHNIPVLKCHSLKKEYSDILKYEPDIIITCAYGKILPKELLNYPKYGCLNIHASILPKYRGSSPIQWALMNGEEATGVTLMYMDEGMDTGDIIATKSYNIKPDDDAKVLFDNLSAIGRDLLKECLFDIVNGNVKREKQDDSKATYAPMLDSKMEELDFLDEARNIHNKIRAFSPTPLVKTKINGEEIKIVKSHYEDNKNAIPNKLYVTKNTLGIGARNGIVYIDIIKPIGKNSMPIKNYLNGRGDLI